MSTVGVRLPRPAARQMAMVAHLAAGEARRLLRNPVLWAAVAGAWITTSGGAGVEGPTLPDIAAEAGLAGVGALLIGFTLLIMASLRTQRDLRGTMPETFGALPGRGQTRTAAVTLAVAGVGLVLAVAFVATWLVVRSRSGPVAGNAPLEVLAAVVGVPTLAVLGAACGRWFPSPVAAPGGVSYCHLPGYAAWVPVWAEVVEPIRAAAPPAVRDDVPAIRQHHVGFRQRGAARRRAAGQVEEIWRIERSPGRLAASVAMDLTGIDPGREPGASCDGSDQARTLVAVWLAEQGTALPAEFDGEDRLVELPGHGYLVYGPREQRAVDQLLRDPATQQRVREHWDALTDPATTLAQGAVMLGLDAPPPGDAADPAVACA